MATRKQPCYSTHIGCADGAVWNVVYNSLCEKG